MVPGARDSSWEGSKHLWVAKNEEGGKCQMERWKNSLGNLFFWEKEEKGLEENGVEKHNGTTCSASNTLGHMHTDFAFPWP